MIQPGFDSQWRHCFFDPCFDQFCQISYRSVNQKGHLIGDVIKLGGCDIAPKAPSQGYSDGRARQANCYGVDKSPTSPADSLATGSVY